MERFRTGDNADPERLHRAVDPFRSVLSGGIGEHHVSANSVVVTTMTDLCFGKLFQKYQEVADPYDPTITPLPADVVELVQTGSWEEVFGKDMEFEQPSIIFAIASFAACIDNVAASATTGPPSSSWAIAVDGVVLPESGPGAYEVQNEAGPPGPASQASRGGLTRFMFSGIAFLVLPIFEGSHRVSLMARVDNGHALHITRVFNRELIVDLLPGGAQL